MSDNTILTRSQELVTSDYELCGGVCGVILVGIAMRDFLYRGAFGGWRVAGGVSTLQGCTSALCGSAAYTYN